MRTFKWLLLIACVGALPGMAHHGISNWDLNTDITVAGKITRFEFISPHSWLHLAVKGADGKTQEWSCEMRSAHSLRRSGWTVEMFRVGSAVTVKGSPERFKPRQCYLSTIQFADGVSMDRYGQRQLSTEKTRVAAVRPARTADGRPNLAGDWAAEQRVMSDPRGQMGTLVPLSQAAKMKPGELPQGQQAFPGARGSAASLASDPIRAAWDRPIPMKLTAVGRKALEKFNPASRDNPRLNCLPTGIIFDWTFDSVPNRVTQTPTRIALQYGHMDLARTIYLDRSARPAKQPLTRAGYSIGQWEGDVLVVHTTGFLPGVLNADSRVLHGSQLSIVERYELDPSTHKLTRKYEAVDPEYFEGTWRGGDEVMPSDVSYSPYRCKDPGGAPARDSGK